MEKILILGFGKSGEAAAMLALSKGFQVSIFDDALFTGSIEGRRVNEIQNKGAFFIRNESDLGAIKGQMIIASPGIDLRESRFLCLKNENELMSEVQFAWKWLKGPVVAITGTNGKSTVAYLIHQLLGIHNVNSILCGNYGRPLSDVVIGNEESESVKIVELSSFQLEETSGIEPEVSILTNLSEDHLNRYDSLGDYERAKLRLFRVNSSQSHWVIDGEVIAKNERLRNNKNLTIVSNGKSIGEFDFQLEGLTSQGYLISSGVLIDSYFKAKHQKDNLTYAICASRALIGNLKTELIVKMIENFQGLPFRFELVGWNGKFKVINDSKSTSPDSTYKALDSLEDPLILLIGGRNKGCSFTQVFELIQKRDVDVIFFGESGKALSSEFSGATRHYLAHSLEEAIDLVFRVGELKGHILFSPGCESFDAFDGYEHRGKVFNRLVKEKFKDCGASLFVGAV